MVIADDYYFVFYIKNTPVMDKDKCRICLGIRKNMVAIFLREKAISYADMMSSLANVKGSIDGTTVCAMKCQHFKKCFFKIIKREKMFKKMPTQLLMIVKDDRITDSICRLCRKKLVEAYEFKVLIERSDSVLYEATNLKKLNFSNINDIKINIEIEPSQVIPKCEDVKEYFKEGVDEIYYSETCIKKLDDLDTCQKPIPVLDFLKTIKDEPYDDCEDNENYDFNNYSTADTDEEYIPPYSMLKSNKTKRKYKKHGNRSIKKKAKITNNNKQNEGQTQVCIKPVLMKDLKYIQNHPKRKPYKKQVSRAKEMCPYCGKMTTTLKQHILQHSGERNCKCDECGKAYFTEAALLKHKLSHSNTRNFACDHCVATFIDKGALKSHLLSHLETKSQICDICSKAFKRKKTLQRHKKMHNSANKSIMCDQCSMSFYTKGALKHHIRIHTGERPYNCQICSQPYSYKHDFNRHCFKKHGVFLKRRSVFVMNEEVLKHERVLMRDLLLRVNGFIKDDKPINPFEGPQAAQAFELAVKALESRQIPIDI